MKHLGIIAEYNPFHNGHYYQIQTARAHFPDKKILVVMSGDYVQRGEPAIFQKHLRAECALSCGADIVLELPGLFAASSAEHFASASILALAATGAVDTVCFGAECDDIDLFWEIADFLLTEPEEYRLLLKQHLKSGLSFPKARSLSLSACLDDPRCTDILKQPNNILAIEYLKAIRKYQLDITPHIIKRQGAGYHDMVLDQSVCSASALRNEIKINTSDYSNKLHNFIPAPAFRCLASSEFAKPLFLSDIYPFLQYALLRQDTSFEEYYEVTEALANRLSDISQFSYDMDTLLENLSGKHSTVSRTRRALLNIVLQRKKEDMEKAKSDNYITYLRLLGFCEDSSFILKEMRTTCTVPLINKVADAKDTLSGPALSSFQKELWASHLYKQAFYNKYNLSMPSEYEQSVIIKKL
ncbi:MAG: nucleotidyltransferase family protein [Lachnospiraceae bacterium]